MGNNTGHTWQEVEDFFIRDKYLNAQEAKNFGIVDEILGDASDIVILNKLRPGVDLMYS
jgi:ATP-dependent Clp protease protease subunit